MTHHALRRDEELAAGSARVEAAGDVERGVEHPEGAVPAPDRGLKPQIGHSIGFQARSASDDHGVAT